jgi:hypothetical protein
LIRNISYSFATHKSEMCRILEETNLVFVFYFC